MIKNMNKISRIALASNGAEVICGRYPRDSKYIGANNFAVFEANKAGDTQG